MVQDQEVIILKMAGNAGTLDSLKLSGLSEISPG